LLVQVYLSMNRLDMAKKTYEAAKSWGEDSLLVQLMEAWIAMRTVRLALLFPFANDILKYEAE
jgi:hypothetical protein